MSFLIKLAYGLAWFASGAMLYRVIEFDEAADGWMLALTLIFAGVLCGVDIAREDGWL